MKKMFFLVLTVFLLSLTSLHAQAAAKKVDPGGPVPLEWTYPTTGPATSFRLYTAPAAAGPFVWNGTAIAPSLRTVTVPANFAPNTLRIFYRLTAVVTAGTDTVESAPVSADREVEMNVASPTGLLVK